MRIGIGGIVSEFIQAAIMQSEVLMSTKQISLIVAALFLVLIVLGGLSWYNTAVALTNATEAQWSNNQNSYDAFWKKVKETAQVTDRYKDDFKQVLIGATELRFSKGGGANVLAIAEDNPALSPAVYAGLQRVIEAGRDDFKRNQTDMLDKQRALKTHLQTVSGGFYGMFSSFPRTESGQLAPPSDLDGDGKLTVLDYPVITSAETKKVFRDGESEPVNVFGK